MFRKRSFNLRTKLILSFLIILLTPTLAVAWGSYTTSKDNIGQQLTTNARDNVDLLNQLIDRNMQPTVRDIEFLAQRLQATADATQVVEPLNQYQSLHKELMHTYVGTEKGQMLIAPKVELPSDFDPRKRPWYQQAIGDKTKTVITEPYVDTDTKQITVTIARATADGQGVVATDLSLQTLADTVKSVKIGQQGFASILDKDRKYLVHPRAEIGAVAKDSFIDSVYQTETGDFPYVLDGRDEHLVFATNKSTGWKLIGTLYVSETADAAKPIFVKTVITVAVAFVVGAMLVTYIIISIMRPIRVLLRNARKVSEGDLTATIDVLTHDELGQLSTAFNTMRESLQNVLRDVNDTATQLAASSEELAASAQETSRATEHIAETVEQLAHGTEQQSVRVEESSRVIGEMSVGIKQIAGNAQTVSESALDAAQLSQQGSISMQTASTQMQSIQKTVLHLAEVVRDLGSRSQQIGEIVTVITGIADQTNLLSLNAAIEASRAGEQGRGFAVVADEVRKLAEQSSKSAHQIAELVVSIQGGARRAIASMDEGIVEVNAGLEVVNLANLSFTQIQNAVEHVTTQVQEVTSAAQQMSAGVEHVVHAIESIATVAETAAAGSQNVSAATEQQLGSMQEIAATSEALTQMADELMSVLMKFKV
ncbi:methyl-accepting chemotaxis protein [Tumebacillus permanentifrigoris]|nr:methyl-accepting chemotaxis protein [Tumebacillus permanentifrigoris]